MSATIIGSAGWDDEYNSDWGENFDEAVTKCLRETSWEQVVGLCTRLRGGVPCIIGHKIKHGSNNLVRLVEFHDGKKWIVRVPIAHDDPRWAASPSTKIKVEVATYKYIKEHTSIPVPEIYAYSADVDQDIGSAFILLEYLHGTIALDFDLDEDKLRKVHEQLASIQSELAMHKFDKIGSLVLDDAGNYSIGTDIETNEGPYRTAEEYYGAVSNHRFRYNADQLFSDNLVAEQLQHKLYLPLIFNNMMPTLTDCAKDLGPFSLANLDLGFNNILLDSELNIVGLIDCDIVIAAPIHVVAQTPNFARFDRPPPGLRTRDESAMEDYEKGTQRFEAYIEMLKAAEEKLGCDNAVSDAATSDAAAFFRGLNHYALSEDDLEAWQQSYLYMYFRKVKGPSYAQEFSEFRIWSDDNEDEEGSDTNNADAEHQSSTHTKIQNDWERGGDWSQNDDWGTWDNNDSWGQEDDWSRPNDENSQASTMTAENEGPKKEAEEYDHEDDSPPSRVQKITAAKDLAALARQIPVTAFLRSRLSDMVEHLLDLIMPTSLFWSHPSRSSSMA